MNLISLIDYQLSIGVNNVCFQFGSKNSHGSSNSYKEWKGIP